MTEQGIADAKRENRQRGKPWWRDAVNLCVLCFLILVGYVSYYSSTPLPFDSAQWKASSSFEKPSVRYRMTDSLLSSKKLDGLNHSQVVSLLGKPDQHNIRDWNMEYTLKSSIATASVLVIKFDKRKRVIECDIQTFN